MNSNLFRCVMAAVITVALSGMAADAQIVRAWGRNDFGQCNVPSDLGACSAIAAGGMHTAALGKDGSVRVWGFCEFGQCDVPANLGVCFAIAAGYYHSVALGQDGAVHAWGSNIHGQCSVPADLGACSAIAAGGYHTLAVRSNGVVEAWGHNNQGQCNTPVDVGPCQSVAGGMFHSIALRLDGSVRAWGFNAVGQCVVPHNLAACESISGGMYHSVALQTSGAVRAWQWNEDGQCDVPDELGPALAISAGGFHTVALRQDGSIRAWGNNEYGQADVPSSLGPCKSIATGYVHTVALACSSSDCNGNGVGDECDLASGSATDINGNGVLDSCECLADIDVNGQVDGVDLANVLGQWGGPGSSDGSADINGDGVVEGKDLAIVLSAWGSCVTVPSWATMLEAYPDTTVVHNAALRASIRATGLAWRVRDTATQIEMVLIPPGTYQRGCSPSAQWSCTHFPEESPVHQVTLTQPFYIGRYEVTQAQWTAHERYNPSCVGGESQPVGGVTWVGVQPFLNATGMRLPSEAEWEYAYRAGTTTAFHSMPGHPDGTNDDSLYGRIAWYVGNTGYPMSTGSRPVGQRDGNGFGLHDMSGNVWEWVNDWYGPYSSSDKTDPTGPSAGTIRVIRGSSFDMGSGGGRSSSRGGVAPDYFMQCFIGFRVARNP